MSEAFTNTELGLRSEIHLVRNGYAVRLIDTDAGCTVPTIRIFPHGQFSQAIAYAQRLVADD